MKSEYLREIDCEMPLIDDDDNRKEIFEKELKKYGLASYDTWNFDITFAQFLYIGFKMYNDCNCVNTHYHKINIGDEIWDMQKCIDYIIEESKNYLINAKKDIGTCNFSEKFFEVLQKVMFFMWW